MAEAEEQPRVKKQKAAGPQLSTLVKFRCDWPELDSATSPAAWQATRAAVQTPTGQEAGCRAFFASGQHVYTARCRLPEEDGRLTGLDGISLPAPDAAPVAVQRVPGLGLTAEVQSIALSESQPGGHALLAAVDAYGAAQLLPVGGERETGAVTSLISSHANTEAGWAGVALEWGEADPAAAVACSFGRCLSVFRGGRELLALGTLHQPHALAFLQGVSRGLLALAEGPHVSMWDARAAGGRAPVARLSPGAGTQPLLCVAGDASGNLLAAAGAEATAVIFDLRRPGLPVARWPSCLKHEVTAIAFPAARSDVVIVGGSDQEIRCGSVAPGRSAAPSMANPNHSSRPAAGEGVSIRGDSRWLGIARSPHADLLVGWAASRHLFLAQFAFPAAA